MFSVRLVKADYYMSTPIPGLDVRYSEFRGVEVKQVPVIRIFGSTGSGQKVCLHLHGVFPYIYIPYDGCIEKEKFVYQIASAVDKALNVSLGNSNSRAQHVYKVTHVSAIPFYGYHSQNHQFLKIYFYNPVMIKKASDLLQNGVILGQVFQPHEAHIPFILQFCMDYNLHGMSFVNLASVRYRQGIVEGSNFKPPPLENVSEEFLLPEHILRISTCSLEVDGVAADILNRQDISGQLTSNPGLKAIWDEEKERRRKENRNSQFTPQSTQTRQPSQTASEKFHLGRLKKRLSEVALLNENSKPTMEKSPGEKPKPYPAPTPDGDDYLNASVLLTHVNSLCHEKEPEKYAAEKLNDTHCEEMDKTGMYAHSDSSDSEAVSSQSSVLNSQCISLVQILQDLIEDDSVLGSQQQKADGDDIERESDDEEVLNQSLDCKESECGNSPGSPLRQTGTEGDQLNQILISNEKNVIGNDEVLNSTFVGSNIETSNVKLQFPLLKSNTYASDWQSCNNKPISEREACTQKSRDISSTSTSSVSPADFQTKESRSDCLNEPYELNRETQSFLIKGDSCKNISQVHFTESLTSPNNSKLSTVNTTMPVKLNFAQSFLDRKSVDRNTIITPKKMPPSNKQIFQSLSDFNFPQQIFLKPFFSNPLDVVERKEVGHKDLKIQSCSVKELDLFESMIPNLKGLKMYKDEAIRNLWEHSQTCDDIENIFNQGNLKAALGGQRETILTPCSRPPSVKEVKLWAKARFLHTQKTKESKKCKNEGTKRLKSSSQKDVGKIVQIPANSSQFSSQGSSAENFPKATDSSNSSVSDLLAQTQFRQQLVTPQAGKSHDSLGFKMSYENLQDCRAVVEPQYLTLLAIELHIQTRGDLCPDPAHDSVCAVFYCVQNDVPEESLEPNLVTGMIVVQNSTFKKSSLIHNIEVNCKISFVPNEKALMEEIIHLVQLWDPDILAGYEVEMLSWGYLFERAFVLEMNLCPLVSRIPGTRQGNKLDESVMELPEEFSLLGRIVLNVWRLMRHEVSLQSYTFENVSFHVLHERIPLVSFKTLTQWWGHRTRCFCGRVADHYLLRVRGLIRILEQLDLLNRTSELARIFGIQFYEVLSRGSQVKHEEK